MREVIDAVEQSLSYFARGQAKMPPKVYVTLPKGDFRAMPAAIGNAAAVKWVNVHPGNPTLGLPTVMAVIIYNDADTGYPLAIMDATEITSYRTGAVAAVASKYLARRDFRTLGIIGAGRQGYTQLMAHLELFTFESIRIADVNPAAVEKMIRDFPQYPLKAASIEEACGSDIVCTVTPAREPVVKADWIHPGTHINAMGADAPGKEELEPAVLTRAKVVVDDIRQAVEGGEINVPISRGLFKPEDVYATLPEIVANLKAARTDSRSITIFDSTGLAVQDLATAGVVYAKAKKRGGYPEARFD